MRKIVSLKMTLKEWQDIEEEYKEWLMTHQVPVSRHKWMKWKIIGGNILVEN